MSTKPNVEAATSLPDGGAASTRAVDDDALMALALQQADEAARRFEIPVGAVVVGAAGELLGAAFNLRETSQDATAHAEILALRAAGRTVGGWRLEGATLAVTLEPCPMCAGAIVNARIRRVVYGCRDPKAGAVDSLYELGRDRRLNHRFESIGGVRERECADRLRDFFARLRNGSLQTRPGHGPSTGGVGS